MKKNIQENHDENGLNSNVKIIFVFQNTYVIKKIQYYKITQCIYVRMIERDISDM